jgi:hypothetical protein
MEERYRLWKNTGYKGEMIPTSFVGSKNLIYKILRSFGKWKLVFIEIRKEESNGDAGNRR